MAYTTIDSPKKYFEAKTYTGTGSSQSITGLSFSPDFVWIKNRSGANSHGLVTSLVNTRYALDTSATSGEVDFGTSGVTSLNSDGFTVATHPVYNSSSNNYISWNWDANGAGSSNTSGTITSTVSANTTSGFSIVSWTGNASNSTVGHSLGTTPSMIIVKNRSAVEAWIVYHSTLGNTKFLELSATDATQTSSTIWNNTSPTSTLFTVGTNSKVNGNTNSMIAYCFAEVKGFSKAFSYTGNGSSDGTYVHLGFRPAWIIIKKSDGSVQNWVIHDSKRSAYNLSQNKLFANLSDAEDTGGTNYNLDILSNGFKLRSSNSDVNSSGGAYIGFAVAENPFVSSKGVSVTAR